MRRRRSRARRPPGTPSRPRPRRAALRRRGAPRAHNHSPGERGRREAGAPRSLSRRARRTCRTPVFAACRGVGANLKSLLERGRAYQNKCTEGEKDLGSSGAMLFGGRFRSASQAAQVPQSTRASQAMCARKHACTAPQRVDDAGCADCRSQVRRVPHSRTAARRTQGGIAMGFGGPQPGPIRLLEAHSLLP